MKKIIEFFKKYWPMIKSFICLDRPETEEMVEWMERHRPALPESGETESDLYPRAYYKAKEKL